jgi:2-(1,2-epoxy-1,2-dihydrophenyl)acetyl-CoA isomerase
MDGVVRWETSAEGIGRLTINRPESRNALTWEAMRLFAEAVEAAHAAPGLRALILTGAGGAFCAGGDLFELDGFPSRADGARLSTCESWPTAPAWG